MFDFDRPQLFRNKLWPILLKIQEIKEIVDEDFYEKLVKLENAELDNTLVADGTSHRFLLKTLDQNTFLKPDPQQITNVVRSFAIIDPQVNYQQPISWLASALLQNSTNEEEAFLGLYKVLDYHNLR